MQQQGAFAGGADAGDFIEFGGDEFFAAAGAVGGDGEAVGFVAQALQEIQHRVARGELEGGAAGHVEPFAAGIAVGAFGDGDQWQVGDAEFFEHGLGGGELAGAAIDEDEVGPMRVIAVGVFGLGAGEAAGEDFAHHGEIIAGGERAFDGEFAVGGFQGSVGSGDDHDAVGVGAHDVGVIVGFDAFGGFGQGEDFGGGGEEFRLAGGFGEFAFEGFAGVGGGVLHDVVFFAALGDEQFGAAAGFEAEGFGDEALFGEVLVEQDGARRGFVVVELDDEGGEDFGGVIGFGVAGEEAAIAVIAAAANEEHLDAALAGFLVQGDDIGVADGVRVDDGIALDVGEAADAVSQEGGAFEGKVLRGLFHFGGELALDGAGFAGEEGFRLADEFVVVGLADAADARGGAAADLVEQAGARAVGEDGIGAGAEQEDALQGLDGLVDRPG